MTDSEDPPPSPSDVGGAPIDFARLTVIAERLVTDDRFARVEERPAFAPDRVVCHYEPGFYRHTSSVLDSRSCGTRTTTFPFTITNRTRTARSIVAGTDLHRITTPAITSIPAPMDRFRVPTRPIPSTGVTFSRQCSLKSTPGNERSGSEMD